MPSSGLLVGCQSMGCMRSSNWDDGLNFHFLMIVQMTAIPPMHDAMTMRTVRVVFLVDVVAPAAEAGAVADAACPVAVCVMVWVLSGMLATGALETPTTLSVWEVWAAEVIEGGAEVVDGTDEVGIELADEVWDDKVLSLLMPVLVTEVGETRRGTEDGVGSVDDDACVTPVVDVWTAELVDELCLDAGSGAAPMRAPRS
jgi:hypothetical protein